MKKTATTQKILFPYLTLAGATPFIVCMFLLLFGLNHLPYLGETTQVLRGYGILIASFMLGSQWGSHLSLSENNPWLLRLPIFTNIMAVLLWLAYLVLSVDVFLLLLPVCFLAILFIDYYLKQAKIIGQDYYRIRVIVTMIVVASLLVSALTLFLF